MLVVVSVLGGCTDQNTDKTEEINELKAQAEQLSLEKERSLFYMDQLISIHKEFKEIGTGDLIIKEENQIHPEVVEKFQRLDFILNEKQR